jgi:hypothetical protein
VNKNLNRKSKIMIVGIIFLISFSVLPLSSYADINGGRDVAQNDYAYAVLTGTGSRGRFQTTLGTIVAYIATTMGLSIPGGALWSAIAANGEWDVTFPDNNT